ncbi:hypothetical protein JVT61DRAFT_181 [Boletus reticuloceps]|uniref:RING-type E3 ubiquitin transferase n=1 Tax=Boletus reticuloceps TaxID=495285 RepID=A0A8I2Z2S0_9AGAM|nr:hypothetical protein JVT61DRAFT_181 [Boletus reticuloceps]
MDRPVTSKSRGICRYYTTPRGCFAGDDCKFLHGADEKLTPYDKAKVCRYYARGMPNALLSTVFPDAIQGHCTRGDQCWFRHDLAKVALDDERIQFNAEACCICLEKPTTYGLLTDCSHIFCLECIRQWRSPAAKAPDVVSSGTIKCCPLCRTPSRFVTPSAHFLANGPRKKETIDAYKASMARIACKYFDETSRTGKPCCPFGTDCFYRHTNSDGTLHVFHHGAKHSMNVYRRYRLRGASFPPARFDYDDPIEFLQHIFENPITNLHATLDVIRASLPALMEGFASSNEPWNSESGEDEEIAGGSTDPPELLEDNLVAHDEAAAPFATVAEGNNAESTPAESLVEHIPLPTQTPLPETHTASQPQSASSSRFSTVMSAHSRQSFIIDISDDDEEEEEEESVPNVSDTGPNSSIESSDSPPLASTPISVVARAATNRPPVRCESSHRYIT